MTLAKQKCFPAMQTNFSELRLKSYQPFSICMLDSVCFVTLVFIGATWASILVSIMISKIFVMYLLTI